MEAKDSLKGCCFAFRTGHLKLVPIFPLGPMCDLAKGSAFIPPPLAEALSSGAASGLPGVSR